jgi:hypothetical protein
MATAPRFLYLSSVVGDNQIGAVSGSVVVEAYVNGEGQVYDYRIVTGPFWCARQGALTWR